MRYKEQKEALKTAVLNSKQAAWSKVCQDIDDDIWGMGYNIVMEKANMFPKINLDDDKQF